MRVDVSQLQKVAQNFWWEVVKKALNNAIEASIATLETEAKKEAPIFNWQLRSWFQSIFRPLKWILFNPEKTAIFVQEWTKPHSAPFDELDKRARVKWIPTWALRYSIKTKWTKANPFLDRAVAKSERKIDSILVKMTNNLIAKLER